MVFIVSTSAEKEIAEVFVTIVGDDIITGSAVVAWNKLQVRGGYYTQFLHGFVAGWCDTRETRFIAEEGDLPSPRVLHLAEKRLQQRRLRRRGAQCDGGNGAGGGNRCLAFRESGTVLMYGWMNG